MTDAVKVGFVPFSTAPKGILVVFCDDALKFGAATRKALGAAADTIKRAAAANQFKGKSGAVLDILAPDGIKIQRLIVIGTGKSAGSKAADFLKFGGVVAGRLNAGQHRRDDFGGIARWRHEAGAGRRDRVGLAAARL